MGNTPALTCIKFDVRQSCRVWTTLLHVPKRSDSTAFAALTFLDLLRITRLPESEICTMPSVFSGLLIIARQQGHCLAGDSKPVPHLDPST